MANIIIFLSKDDLPAVIALTQKLDAYIIYVFDPSLLDSVFDAGLNNIKFISADGCFTFHEFDQKTRDNVTALEKTLDEMVSELLPNRISITGWQYRNWYHLLQTCEWFMRLWPMASDLFKGHTLHIIICNLPSLFYINSFVPSVLCFEYFQQQGYQVVPFIYQANNDDALLVPDLHSIPANSVADLLLTHIPTCRYDYQYLVDEITRCGPVLNLTAKFCDIPFNGQPATQLITADEAFSHLSHSQKSQLNQVTSQLKEAIQQQLSQYIQTPSYLEKQAQYTANLYRDQLTLFFQLEPFFEKHKPTKIILSDHDIGYHGPLIAFAKQHSLPVIYLPHSKMVHDIEYSYRNITALTHPAQNSPILDPLGKPLPQAKILFPEEWNHAIIPAKPIQTIALMLNAFTIQGVYFAQYQAYLDGIRQIYH